MKQKQKTHPIYFNGPTVKVRCLDIHGEEYTRSGTIKYLYLNDIVYIDANDSIALQPRSFFVRQAVDWLVYLDGIADSWKHYMTVPYQFKFFKKVHPDIIENFGDLPLKEKKIVLESLRHNGFLPKLRMLKNGLQPKELEWGEVAGLCLKTVPVT